MGTENQAGGGSSKDNRIDFAEKFRALAVGEKIILIAGPILFIVGFFHWYSGSTCVVLGSSQVCGSGSASAWEAPHAVWSIFAILIGLAMSGVVVIRSLSPGTISDNVGGISWPKIQLGAGVVAALFILIKLLSQSSNLSIGFFLGIIAVAALVAGGFFMYREEQGKPLL